MRSERCLLNNVEMEFGKNITVKNMLMIISG